MQSFTLGGAQNNFTSSEMNTNRPNPQFSLLNTKVINSPEAKPDHMKNTPNDSDLSMNETSK